MTARRALVALVLLAALAGGWWLWQRAAAPALPQVITAPVTRGAIEETVLASGTLRPARLVAVGSQVSGRITEVAVTLGQTVKAGDLIAQIDSRTQTNALRTAEASLASTRAQRLEKEATLALARQVLDRQTELRRQRAVSQADMDMAEADVAVAQAQIAALDAQIQQAQVAVDTAGTNLGFTRITAPVDGTVLAVTAQEGQTLNANQSTPTIVVLGQLDRMVVEAQISEADILKVAPGQAVWFTVLGARERRYDAVLESIEPAPETITADRAIASGSAASSSSTATSAIYYNGILTVPNPDGRLKTYMTAEVHVVLGRAEQALTVPSAALGGQGGRRVVQVLGADGRVAEREVRVGLDDRVRAEILSGLEEGERVVTGEAAAAAPGARRGPRGPMGF